MTDGWVSHPLAPGLRVEVVAAPPAPPPAADAAVERIGAAARAARPALFNGRVFSALVLAPDRISGFWTDYRHAFAQMREPALFGVLGIRPLAVNGVLEGPDGIVFGRRDGAAVYQPGLWQCPPAGSVEARNGHDGVDLREQLVAELEEELGMSEEAVDGFRPLAAVEHPGSRVIDVGIGLRTSWSAGRIAGAHRAKGNGEYGELCVVPRGRATAQIAGWGAGVVPTASVFVETLLAG